MRLAIACVLLGAAIAPAAAQGFGPDLFAPPALLPLGTGAPGRLLARDLDADGHVDLIVQNNDLGGLFVQRGDGLGGFTPQATVPFTGLWMMASYDIAPLDEDGLPDLVVVKDFGIQTHVGLGAGTFGPAVDKATPPQTNSQVMALADFSGDGLTDLVIECNKGPAAELLGTKGQGDGTFGAFGVLADTRHSLRLHAADFDLDGDIDLFSDTAYLAPGFEMMQASVSVYLNQGDGSLLDAGPALPVAWNTFTAPPADLDLDGAPDLLAWKWETGEMSLLRGDGQGHLDQFPLFSFGVSTSDALPADLDADGYFDVLALTGTSLTARWLSAQRLVRLEPQGAVSAWSVPLFSQGFDAADANEDGLVDSLVAAIDDFGSRVELRSNALGPVADLGLGSPGGPVLSASGQPAPGQLFTVSLDGVGKGAQAALVLGLQPAHVSVFGVLLVPEPLGVLPIPAKGVLSATWPDDVPDGTLVYLQALVASGAGVEASNALLVVPSN